MSIFEYVVAALLLIAGLGITQLLGDAVDTFRSRQKIIIHWIPLAWIGLVFVWQMQFVWAIFELNDLIKFWTADKYVVLLIMALLLYISGALVVPRASETENQDTWDQFMQDGRWALVSLACFFFLAFFTNPLLFEIPLLLPGNMMDFFLGLVLVCVQISQKKTVWAFATVIFAVLSIFAVIALSPPVYQ